MLTATLSYNAAGQRAGYSVVIGAFPYYSAQFSYRGDALGQAIIVSGTQSYTDTYLYDQNGSPLELLRQTKSGSTLATARYWYEEDGRGNVVALTDVTGTVVDRYAYDAWGNLIGSSEQVPQRLRYAGYWYDQEFGWDWVSIRYYDPLLGRWLAPDPSQQDGVRTYVYVGDDPVDENDPTGLAAGDAGCPIPVPDTDVICDLGRAAAAAGGILGGIGLIWRAVSTPVAQADTRTRRGQVRFLYHYTFARNIRPIEYAGELWASLPENGDAQHGPGQYLTDLTPEEASTADRFTVSRALFNTPFHWSPGKPPYPDIGWIKIDVGRSTCHTGCPAIWSKVSRPFDLFDSRAGSFAVSRADCGRRNPGIST